MGEKASIQSESAAQEATEKKSGGVSWNVWLCLFVPFVYVLSIGPASRLAAEGYFHDELFRSAVSVVYAPLEWLGRICPPFGKFITWYVMVWMR